MRYDSLFNEHFDDADHNLNLLQLIDKLFQFNGLNKICFIGTSVAPTRVSQYWDKEDHLAINYDLNDNKDILVKDFHKILINHLGKTKGDNLYDINKNSLVWAAPNSSEYTNLMIIDVIQMGNIVYLVTLENTNGY